MIGDWMGSIYDVGGRRHDIRLFIDHDGRYERTVRSGSAGVQSVDERREVGCWTAADGEDVLRLQPDAADGQPSRWWVLSVTTCEDSNVLLVLREVILASRNLPILFYRVHCDGRGYGTGWQERLAGSNR
jgi:hypothetical protein